MSELKKFLESFDPIYSAIYGWQYRICEGDECAIFGYVGSFKESADILVEQIGQADLLLFPIMFCYRQYLELILKRLCEKNMEREDYKQFIHNVSHNLIKILDKAKTFFKNYEFLGGEQTELLTEMINFFDEYDRNSFNFRYPTDKNLNKSIHKSNFRINLKILKEAIDMIDGFMRFTYDSVGI